MYMGSLLTNITVSADLSAVKCLDVTCQIWNVLNVPLPDKEIGVLNMFQTCFQHSLAK